VSMLGIPSGAEIEILTDENEATYWERSDQFDMALDLTIGRRGLVSLGIVMEQWLKHMLSLDVAIEPIAEMRDVRLTWYVGLDAEGTRIGDALWHGEALDEHTRNRVVALFRLTGGSADLAEELTQGEAVYLILAMAGDKMLRMKPQNLLTGLPARQGTALT